METTTFVPKLPNKTDRISRTLLRVSQFFFVTAIASVPLFFIPNISGIGQFPKVYVVLLLLLLSGVMLSLSILRSGSITLRMSPLVLSWWCVVGVAMVSAIISPNIMSGLFGDVLEIHTVGFLALMGFVMSMSLTMNSSKISVLYLLGLIGGGVLAVILLFLVRLVAGVETLSFGVLANLSDNLIGSFNDMGIVSGLLVILTMVAMVQLSLPRLGLMFSGIVLFLALFTLVIVNFFFVWLVIALFSLMLLMYSLTKDRFGVPHDVISHHNALSLASTCLIGAVFMVSAVFLIGGSNLGTSVSSMTGVSYIEIRPSMTATMDILRQVYAENAFTGFGPNRFLEAWTLYKDQSINNTVFWGTPFSAAAGYVPTWFVTTGLLGVVAWVLFLGLFVYTGLRTLIKGQSTDIFWYFVGTISFVGGLFMWLLSIVYVPGPAVLIICSVMTGLMVVSNQILVPRAKNSYNLLSSSKTGFILIASVMVFIIGAIAVGYGSVRQLSAAYIYSTAENNLPTDRNQFDVVSERMLSAYNLYPSDTYMRGAAGYQYAHFNSLLSIQNSTPEQQQEFQAAVTNAIKLSSDAVAGKSTDSRNWQLAADIFASISLFKPEAMDMAFERYRNAEVLDPQNPYYVLQKAAMEFRVKNYDEASALTQMSLQLKPNFTDALFLSSQIDIAKGDINKAIITTQAMISLESNNPGRYYQLGVLQAAAKNTDASIDAFTAAVNLNPTYANARYFRAQQYLIKGDKNLAISEFEAVRDMSPDNSSVNELISKIKNGEVTGDTLNQEQPVTESSTVTVENEVATTSTVPESNLLTPVNTPTVKTEVNDSATVAE